MSAEILRRAAAEIRIDCPIAAHGRALDFIDYSTGWALQRAGLAHANEQCSAAQTSGAMLCDCAALDVSWRHWRALLAVADWLDSVADAATSPDEKPGAGRMVATADEQHAVNIATAYFGEAS